MASYKHLKDRCKCVSHLALTLHVATLSSLEIYKWHQVGIEGIIETLSYYSSDALNKVDTTLPCFSSSCCSCYPRPCRWYSLFYTNSMGIKQLHTLAKAYLHMKDLGLWPTFYVLKYTNPEKQALLISTFTQKALLHYIQTKRVSSPSAFKLVACQRIYQGFI